MSDKLVWSSNGTHDHLSGLSREDKLANLPDYGYEADMIADMDDDGLANLIDTSDNLWQIDSEDFETRIIPAINAQTEDGFVVVGDAEEPIMTDDLISCCEALYNRDGRLVTDSGDVIYFMDEDGYKIPIDADQLDVIEESVNVNEAKTKEPETLEAELEQIKPLAEEYGFEFFSSMPFTNFEEDEQSLEYQYPEFFKICKAFFREMEIVDDMSNIDELEDNWYSIDQHDWDTIIKVCDKLVANPDKSQQFEKIYKDGFDGGLDDVDAEPEREFKVSKPDYKVATKTSLDRSYEESYKLSEGFNPERVRAKMELGEDAETDRPLEISDTNYIDDRDKRLDKRDAMWNYLRKTMADEKLTPTEWNAVKPSRGKIARDHYKDYEFKYGKPFDESLNEEFGEPAIFDKITQIGLQSYGVDDIIESWGDEDIEPEKDRTPLREDEEDDEQAAREAADYQAYLRAVANGEYDHLDVDEALERSNNIKAYYRRMEGLDPEEEITDLKESAFNSTSCYWHESPENLRNILLSK